MKRRGYKEMGKLKSKIKAIRGDIKGRKKGT
jgi:hypothetical protein